MAKRLSPKQSFLLLYISTAAFIVIPFVLKVSFYGLAWFVWPFLFVMATFFVVIAIPSARMALAKLEIPEKYSPKHFLLLLWLTGQAFFLGIMLHNGIYALGGVDCRVQWAYHQSQER